MQKNFKDIKEIYETSDQTEVNIFLKKGWHLLDIYQKNTGTMPVQQIVSVYIIGRPEHIVFTVPEIKKEIDEEAKKNFLKIFLKLRKHEIL